MGYENVFGWAGETAQPSQCLFIVGVRREVGDRGYLGMYRYYLAVDLYLLFTFEQPPASCALGLVSDKKYGAARIRQTLLQVKEDSPARCHSRGRDDYAR